MAGDGPCGVEGVEVGVYDVAEELSPQRTALRAPAAEHELPVVAVLLSLPPRRWPGGALTRDPHAVAAQALGYARACADLGLSTLGLWPGADPAGAPWDRLVEGVAHVRNALEPAGVRLAVEYKPGTAVASAADAIRLSADVPGTGVLLDTGHAYAAGEDPTKVVRQLGARLGHVHLGDAAKGNADDDLPETRIRTSVWAPTGSCRSSKRGRRSGRCATAGWGCRSGCRSWPGAGTRSSRRWARAGSPMVW
ncbi:MAG: sugar phosphate isomerase/epimerase family protein [Egibacteraceae bacterium]